METVCRKLSVEEQIMQKIKEQGINMDNRFLLIDNSLFQGNTVEVSISDDMKWVCIPVLDEDSSYFFGEYVYKPKVFKIDAEYECWTEIGSMCTKRNVKILRE